MKYVSIDIETCGLNSDACDIIEFAAVLEDTIENRDIDDLSYFHSYILPPTEKNYSGEPYALSMHAAIFRKIADYYNGKIDESSIFLAPGKLSYYLDDWLHEYYFGGTTEVFKSSINIAGKNFAEFDLKFLQNLPSGWDIQHHRRVLDPAILYWNPKIDEYLPDMKTCMKRAGFEGEVAHTALDDARMVIKLIRKYYE